MRDIFLRSGKWRWSNEQSSAAHGPRLEFIDPSAPRNKLMAPAPRGWDRRGCDALVEAAREPDLRLWVDEHGIPWRIARIGPESYYPYKLDRPHLVFDSDQAFAGIVEVDPHARLGEFLDVELAQYRDRMRDFGGRRRGFRPPQHHA